MQWQGLCNHANFLKPRDFKVSTLRASAPAPSLLDRRGFPPWFFLYQRLHGEKLMPARSASQRGNPQHSPQHRSHSRDMLRSDSLQVHIATNSAMRVKVIANRDGARVKPRSAFSTPPRQDATKTK